MHVESSYFIVGFSLSKCGYPLPHVVSRQWTSCPVDRMPNFLIKFSNWTLLPRVISTLNSRYILLLCRKEVESEKKKSASIYVGVWYRMFGIFFPEVLALCADKSAQNRTPVTFNCSCKHPLHLWIRPYGVKLGTQKRRDKHISS